MNKNTLPANTYGVGRAGDQIFVARSVPQHMSSQDAINLAAWLANASTNDPESEFFPVFNEIYLSGIDNKLIF